VLFGIELRTAVVHEVIWHPWMSLKTIEPAGRAMIGVACGPFVVPGTFAPAACLLNRHPSMDSALSKAVDRIR
jgi:hypothetical protein